MEQGLESKYKFKEKDSYIEYINNWFPYFKDELEKYIQFDNKKVSINKKFRQVIGSFKHGKLLGNIIYYYKLSKVNFEEFILNNGVNFIIDDFSEFYKRYVELERILDRKLGFGKRMGNDLYIHKNYEFYIPKNILLYGVSDQHP